MALKINFVVLTRNRLEALEQCLDALSKEVDNHTSCVVIDNSDEVIREEVIECCKKYPWVTYKWVQSSPYILSQGRNIGAAMSNSDVIAFLDDDSYISEGWIKVCRESFESSETGAIGGPIDDPEVSNLDHSRECEIGAFNPKGEVIDNFDCIPPKTVVIKHMRGCNWAIRKKVFDECGGFDETLSGYCFEELDLSLNIRSKGYKIKFHPNLRVYHDLKPRIDGEKPQPFRIFEVTRNLSRIYRKYDSRLCCSYWKFFFLYRTGIVALLREPSYSNFLSFAYGIRGKFSGLMHR
ncbi:glycosyltransferase family 2 protein [Rubellicoccus peritrichatus]|uniref:Glycosyltransferase n=1 Tax=Rubellicoccus peritrichatus TaxID=3080537 RepID=A0AAQ3QRL0_9BACT|nr:glycosyltransferase [Puniceicoccus sp. CR14]WOO41438.1 glycosyltransferase [Puniceicoccus sp. CR14]